MRRLLPFLLFAATVCFTLGIVLPLIRMERLFLFTDEPSLAAMVYGLWTGGDMVLATVVGLFSIAFPALKLGLLHVAAYDGAEGHRLVPGWFKALSRWSLLDVVLVALVIFASKTSGLATASTQPGLWFFAASVILTAASSSLVKSEG